VGVGFAWVLALAEAGLSSRDVAHRYRFGDQCPTRFLSQANDNLFHVLTRSEVDAGSADCIRVTSHDAFDNDTPKSRAMFIIHRSRRHLYDFDSQPNVCFPHRL
jgi:hypothetical protein